MKRTLLMSLVALFSLSLMAQNRIQVPKNLQNIAVKIPIYSNVDDQLSQYQSIIELSHSKAISTEEIGQTFYDLQSQGAVDHRIYMYTDGTIGTTYTVGTGTYADRGTGYNYYNGTTWTATVPTARIEDQKTGWPSYSHLGTNNEGEVVIAHNGTTLVMNKRAAKGTGAWTQSLLPTVGGVKTTWPRICTSGNTIHVLSAESDTGHTYEGQKYSLFYSRSTDAGATWDKQNVILPEINASVYPKSFNGSDGYSWAEPRGNTIAFVAGRNWTDMILMKSTDGGNTWTKTMIFQHPYPNWNDNILTPDTPYVVDGSHAVELDASGNAHVVFGVMRVLNDVAGDNKTSYFPGVDGIGYWKEGDATIANLMPDSLYAHNKLIAWVQDMDGNDSLFQGYTAIENWPKYFLSLSSMPQLTIDGNNMYLIYKSTVENMQSTAGQFFNHIWGRKSIDSGQTWGDFVELTTGDDFFQMECVYPTLSKTTNNNLHVTFQMDFEPGLSINGDLDPAASNSIMYLSLAKSDLTVSIADQVNLNGNVNVYPNPATDNMNIYFSFNKSTNVNMTILNMVGSSVMNEKYITEKGVTKQINISNLPVGIYLAKFETASGTYTQKIMKK